MHPQCATCIFGAVHKWQYFYHIVSSSTASAAMVSVDENAAINVNLMMVNDKDDFVNVIHQDSRDIVGNSRSDHRFCAPSSLKLWATSPWWPAVAICIAGPVCIYGSSQECFWANTAQHLETQATFMLRIIRSIQGARFTTFAKPFAPLTPSFSFKFVFLPMKIVKWQQTTFGILIWP